jgi:hypothetical protein
VSTIVIAFLVHTPLSSAAFRLLTCQNVAPADDPSNSQLRLVMNLDVRCTDPAQLGLMLALAVPTIVVVSVGVPALAVMGLAYIGAERVRRPPWSERVGFLVNGYKPQLYFWESVVLLRKVLLAFATTTLAPVGPGMQVTTACMVVTFALVVHARCHPFANDAVNMLEMVGLATAVITLLGGLYVYLHAAGEATVEVAAAASVVIALANGVFLVLAVLLVAQAKQGVLGRQLQAVAQRMGWMPVEEATGPAVSASPLPVHNHHSSSFSLSNPLRAAGARRDNQQRATERP